MTIGISKRSCLLRNSVCSRPPYMQLFMEKKHIKSIGDKNVHARQRKHCYTRNPERRPTQPAAYCSVRFVLYKIYENVRGGPKHFWSVSPCDICGFTRPELFCE